MILLWLSPSKDVKPNCDIEKPRNHKNQSFSALGKWNPSSNDAKPTRKHVRTFAQTPLGSNGGKWERINLCDLWSFVRLFLWKTCLNNRFKSYGEIFWGSNSPGLCPRRVRSSEMCFWYQPLRFFRIVFETVAITINSNSHLDSNSSNNSSSSSNSNNNASSSNCYCWDVRTRGGVSGSHRTRG